MNDGILLTDARERWKSIISGKGGNCPCCDRYGKIYCYGITGSMVHSLFRFLHLCAESKYNDGDGWVIISAAKDIYLQRYRAHSKLKWFEFLEQDKGQWRITNTGLSFLKGFPAPRKVFVYDDKVLGFSKDTMTASEARGRTFDYQKLMEDSYEDWRTYRDIA